MVVKISRPMSRLQNKRQSIDRFGESSMPWGSCVDCMQIQMCKLNGGWVGQARHCSLLQKTHHLRVCACQTRPNVMPCLTHDQPGDVECDRLNALAAELKTGPLVPF